VTIESAIAIANAVAATLQVVFIVLSIWFVNRQFAITRACSYIERFNSDEHIRRRAIVDQWLESSPSDEERLAALTQSAELRANVYGFLNLFQELGVAYRYHSVHRTTVRETFDYLVPDYWRRTRFLVDYVRRPAPGTPVPVGEEPAPTAYRKFELLAQDLQTSSK